MVLVIVRRLIVGHLDDRIGYGNHGPVGRRGRSGWGGPIVVETSSRGRGYINVPEVPR